MLKGMKIDLNPFSSLQKHNYLFVKFLISFLFIALGFRLFVSDSFRISSSVAEPPPVHRAEPDAPPVISNSSAGEPISVDLKENENLASQNDSVQCDLSVGNWVPDPLGPVYTNETCKMIEDHQNCMRNGRPDSAYLYWRWKPRDCDLPRFSPGRFLELVRNKSWAFVGDSISRNHVQSLICILSQVEQAVEVYHDKEYRSKIWRFDSHNFTLSVIWSPFLLKAEILEDSEGVSSSEIKLHLDELDKKWTDQYRKFDHVVIAGGKWFLKTAIYYENNTVTGCHYCPGKNLTELGFEHAYKKALQLVLRFVTESDHKAVVLLRTTTPDHFENGEWFSGGTCNRTMPFREGQTELKDVDYVMRNIELEAFEKVEALGIHANGVVLKLLDTTMMSQYRPDGHPGPYRHLNPFAGNGNATVQNDCLHWCLPGPIDSWNDLVMEMLINNQRYR